MSGCTPHFTSQALCLLFPPQISSFSLVELFIMRLACFLQVISSLALDAPKARLLVYFCLVMGNLYAICFQSAT